MSAPESKTIDRPRRDTSNPGFDVTCTIGRVVFGDGDADGFHQAMRIVADDAVNLPECGSREYQFLSATVTVKFDGYGG